ncbi:MAG: hypothetical protein AUI52_03330 [Acidobacteria bacterium 13_1_40CM_2_68_10]|nr:MAG: hypothetical protein AUI52_03330 [Acidobacteria bacterium 13_1_40CM_2_68_10]
MKQVLRIVVVMALGLVLATPALADRRAHYRGHSVRVVRGGYHTVYYSPYSRPRYRASLVFGFGVPFFAPAPVYLYSPAPIVVGPGYCEPVWVPGHYVYDEGARVHVAGYWSR